jgi:2-oxoglutarate-Fe(II)-dependent oxygenase superfamily protein
MIQLTRTGVVFSGSESDLTALRSDFERNHYVILPKLFEPELLQMVLKRIASSRFVPFEHQGIGLEFCMDDRPTISLLNFIANIPAFLRLIEQITSCGQIGEYSGRVYRMTSSDGHYDNWHDDSNDGRLLTMSVNLTPQPFRGGALQMRRYGSEQMLHEIHNSGLGDALLFRISPEFEHRVQAVEGNVPKTALAGWFISGKTFHEAARERVNCPPVHDTADPANLVNPAPRQSR